MRERRVRIGAVSLRLRSVALVAGLALSAVAAVVLLAGSVLDSGRSAAAGGRYAAGTPTHFNGDPAAGRSLGSLPLAAQSAVSAALGAESPAYRAHRSGGGYRLEGGGVVAQVDTRGAALRAGGGSLSMAVGGVGRGDRIVRWKVLSVDASANRVSLDRGGLTEWYAAGPLGIEQGFTLSRRPAGTAGPVRIALSLGNARASRTTAGAVLLRKPGRPALRYGALSAIDANGKPLGAALRLDGRGLSIRVWDRGASYPLLIDPLIQQGAKLGGAGATGAAQLGVATALSGDGNTALVGGYADNGFAGAAWVFTRSGGTWTQQGGKLTGSGASGLAGFGFSVSLSADGNTALIGGYGDNSNVGAAWVFTRSGSTWTQQGGKLTGSGESGQGAFGVGVRVSGDGNTAVIGGPDDNARVGATWVFTRSGATWTQQGGKLTCSGENGAAGFGAGVAVSSDGSTVLIGGPFDNATSEVGAAWVFTRAGGIWSQQGGKLTGSSAPAGAWFGWTVALSADGSTALIGGPTDNGGLGAAWVFAQVPPFVPWTQQGPKLTGSGASGLPNLGYAVALSGDANTGLAGGPTDNIDAGAAWVFTVTAPAAPTGVLAVADDAQATVSFTGPLPPVTSYTVTASPGGVTATGAASTIVVGGLTNGTTYTFTVTATNGAGTSPASTPSNAVTPIVQVRSVPDPPPVGPRPGIPVVTVPVGPRPPVPAH